MIFDPSKISDLYACRSPDLRRHHRPRFCRIGASQTFKQCLEDSVKLIPGRSLPHLRIELHERCIPVEISVRNGRMMILQESPDLREGCEVLCLNISWLLRLRILTAA